MALHKNANTHSVLNVNAALTSPTQRTDNHERIRM